MGVWQAILRPTSWHLMGDQNRQHLGQCHYIELYLHIETRPLGSPISRWPRSSTRGNVQRCGSAVRRRCSPTRRIDRRLRMPCGVPEKIPLSCSGGGGRCSWRWHNCYKKLLMRLRLKRVQQQLWIDTKQLPVYVCRVLLLNKQARLLPPVILRSFSLRAVAELAHSVAGCSRATYVTLRSWRRRGRIGLGSSALGNAYDTRPECSNTAVKTAVLVFDTICTLEMQVFYVAFLVLSEMRKKKTCSTFRRCTAVI